MHIAHPYLLFLGDAPDMLAAKTAIGVAGWRPDWCLGQLRLPGCQADLGLEDTGLREAADRGARTLVIGVANRGGVIDAAWRDTLIEALEAGLDIASGLHARLSDVPGLAALAQQLGRRLFDVRHWDRALPVGTGVPRSGRRLLAVGTDCSVGKMYTTLAIELEMRARGIPADFRATGQTGILIAGAGIAVDAVIGDFISGAIEQLSPAAPEDHWDVIEGQGSLFHPSFSGVALGLLHGAQPDALVLCHEPTRVHMRGLPDRKLPDLETCLNLNMTLARQVNPAVRCVGIALNTQALDDEAAETLLTATQARFGLPCVDPVRTGVAALVDQLDR